MPVKRRNVKKTSGEIYIKGTKYQYNGDNKEDLIQLMKMLCDKYA
jgi:hypothetical protein